MGTDLDGRAPLRRVADVRRGGLRRYPALGFLALAAALAMLLPSRLSTPRADPGSLSEFAPVPGRSQGSGDLGDLAQGQSGARGSSRSGPSDASRAIAAPAPTLGSPHPKLKRCVGTPPRQQEDLLSPPCVSSFDGDNGGATTTGVTRDEVRVVLTTNAVDDAANDGYTDCGTPRDPDDTPGESACRAYMRFFNDRYQTYGRTVHLWLYDLPANISADAAVSQIRQDHDPFAIVEPGAEATQFPAAAARRRIFGVSFSWESRAESVERAPYQIAFRPDREDRDALLAGFVCSKLAGRPARFSLADGNRTRVFGMWSKDADIDRVDAELRARCGERIAARADITRASNPAQAAALSGAGVTTVIVQGGQAATAQASNTAAAQAYVPEWVVGSDPDDGGNDTNPSGRQSNAAEWQGAFGLTFDYRRDGVADQAWFQAFAAGCDVCGMPADANTPRTYDKLSMLFYGIQAAGPRLTPANFDRGLHSIPQQGSLSPYRPAAYFASGNYTFVKDAAAIWWDSNGQAPDDPQPGCWRLSFDGRRSRASEWPEGDDDIQRPGVACQASPVPGR